MSSVVRSAFTNMKSPIGKNVRLCDLQYMVLVREMLDVGGLLENVLFGDSFMISHVRFMRGRILCDAIALREAWFVRLRIIDGRIFSH